MAYRQTPDPRIVEFLFEAMQRNDTSSSIAGQMRYHATLALGELGDPRAVGPLLEILQNTANHHMMRQSTVWKLGELGDERVLEALIAVYEETQAGEAGADVGERPWPRYEFQDDLLEAIAKIRERLSTVGADADSSGSSAAT